MKRTISPAFSSFILSARCNFEERFFRPAKAFNIDFVCLYARGRRIPHTHIFLVPTYKGDLLDRFFNALEVAQESPSELAKIKQKKSLAETAKKFKAAAA